MFSITRATMTNGEPRYYINNADGKTAIVWFNNLHSAALVLRYLNGDPMSEEDEGVAKHQIKMFDARRERK